MDSDEQQLTILLSFFDHADISVLTDFISYKGDDLRLVAHTFQNVVTSPQGQALTAFPEWNEELAKSILKDMPSQLRVIIEVLLRLKHIDNHEVKH